VDDDIDDVIDAMERSHAALNRAGDARRFFHGTYLRTTRAVAAEIAAGGFADPAWLRRWDVAFARYYLDALDASSRGAPVARPWQVAFDAAAKRADLPPIRHVLFGMNAHINYDLPQALLDVIGPEDFDDPAVVSGREADHQHLDEVLQSRVGAEDVELQAVSRVTVIDRLLQPANRAASRRFLAEARAKVWDNAVQLDRARRRGPAPYADRLGELEELCEVRLRRLAAPGPVLLNLARRGFGVRLSPEAE
jgi:uncharacterized protein DUF5995